MPVISSRALERRCLPLPVSVGRPHRAMMCAISVSTTNNSNGQNRRHRRASSGALSFVWVNNHRVHRWTSCIYHGRWWSCCSTTLPPMIPTPSPGGEPSEPNRPNGKVMMSDGEMKRKLIKTACCPSLGEKGMECGRCSTSCGDFWCLFGAPSKSLTKFACQDVLHF